MSQARRGAQTVTETLVALGANLPSPAGSPAQTVAAAIGALAALPGARLIRASALHATPCMPAGAGPDYVNAAALLETEDDAPAFLARLHAIEARFDRERAGRWGARTLDLDLLDHGGAILPDRETWQAWA